MKILWSLPVRGETLPSGRGDLVRAQQLSAALKSAGHDVVMVSDAQRPGASMAISAYRGGVRRVVPRRLALILRDLGRWLHGHRHGAWLARAAEQAGAELIIETQVAFSPSGAVAARRTGLPLVLDDCTPSVEEATFGVGLPRLARAVQRHQADAAKIVVAVSSAARDLLVGEGVPADRIRIIPNGVDCNSWRRASRERGRRQLGLNGDRVIGFVGSFQPWHRAEWLVAGLSELADSDCRLVLVGDGPGRQEALKLADDLGLSRRVLATGALSAPQIPDVVSAFDVGVMPGTNDYGQPMKLWEYAAAGIPCVAPNRAPIREVVDNGVTGLLFEPEDRAGLFESTNRLLEDTALASRMGKSAREKAFASASWTTIAAELLS